MPRLASLLVLFVAVGPACAGKPSAPCSFGVSPTNELVPISKEWSEPGSNRRRFVRVAEPLAEAFADFPAPLILDSKQIDYVAAGARGEDLRFVDGRGVPLAHEIEEWNPQGTSVVWVRLSRLEQGGGFWMYYGKAASSGPAPDRAKAVWPSVYRAVWHFAGSAKDSTAYQQDGAETKVQFVPGRLGQAAALDSGAKQYVKLGEDTTIVSGARAVTVSAWVQHRGNVRDNQDIVLGIGTAKHEGHLSRVSVAVSPELRFVGEANPDETRWQVAESSDNTSPSGEWHYLTVVIDVAGKSIALYRDGVSLGAPLAGTWTAPAFGDSPANRVTIGCEEDKSKSYFNGLIDELRVETTARSAGWIAAQARAVSGQLLIVGTEEKR